MLGAAAAACVRLRLLLVAAAVLLMLLPAPGMVRFVRTAAAQGTSERCRTRLKHDDNNGARMMPSTESVLNAMASVDSYFQLSATVGTVTGIPSVKGYPNNDWTGGVYAAGLMAHYRASKNESLLEYAVRWGDSHGWKLAGYRGCHGTMGCPDNICAGQAYAEVYTVKRNETMLAGIRGAVEAATQRSCAVRTNRSQAKDSDECWWWVDALLMALPTYARVGAIAGGEAAERIWDAARAQYNITAYGLNSTGADAFNLWSPDDGLFYRDDSFIGKTTQNKKKVRRAAVGSPQSLGLSFRCDSTAPFHAELPTRYPALLAGLLGQGGRLGVCCNGPHARGATSLAVGRPSRVQRQAREHGREAQDASGRGRLLAVQLGGPGSVPFDRDDGHLAEYLWACVRCQRWAATEGRVRRCCGQGVGVPHPAVAGGRRGCRRASGLVSARRGQSRRQLQLVDD
jgi:hypothetical protein